jgi:hypothetical protein
VPNLHTDPAWQAAEKCSLKEEGRREKEEGKNLTVFLLPFPFSLVSVTFSASS